MPSEMRVSARLRMTPGMTHAQAAPTAKYVSLTYIGFFFHEETCNFFLCGAQWSILDLMLRERMACCG